MSIERTLFLGLSGMNANGQALNVVGDNIANMNTIGFKGGRSMFEEMLGQSLIGSNGVSMLGGGVGFGGVDKIFAQGALLGTGVPTDMAITGEGFFALEGEMNGSSSQFFTRAGQFHIDKDGYIASPMGLKLLGYGANGNGDVGSTLQTLKLNDAPFPPVKTGKIELVANLDASSDVADPFNLQEPGKSDFTTDVTIYDELGKPYQASVHFTKDDANKWSYNVVVDGDLVEQPDPPADSKVIASGTIEFETDGKLKSVTSNPTDFTPKGGQKQDLAFDFTGTTQFDTEKSEVSKIEQDGNQAGVFQSLAIDKDGNVTGTFSNGKERVIGQVALARFRSTAGLRGVGAGLFQGSVQSGTVTLGAAGTGGRGGIQAGALEQSTVDIAQEFTQMILAQRGYQANSRTISTADQMLQEAVNLKR